MTIENRFANIPFELQQLLNPLLAPGERLLYLYPGNSATSQSGWVVLTDRRYYRLFQGKLLNTGTSWLYTFEQIQPQSFHLSYAKSGTVTLKLAGKGKVKYSTDGSIEPDSTAKWQDTVSTFDSLEDALAFCQLFYKVYGGRPNESQVIPDESSSVAQSVSQLSSHRQTLLRGLLAPGERVLLLFDNYSIIGVFASMFFPIAFLSGFSFVFGSSVLSGASFWVWLVLALIMLGLLGVLVYKLRNRQNADQLVLTNGRVIQISSNLVKAFPIDQRFMRVRTVDEGRATIQVDGDIVDDCFYEEDGPITGIQHSGKVEIRQAIEIIARYGMSHSVEIRQERF